LKKRRRRMKKKGITIHVFEIGKLSKTKSV